MDSSSNIIRLKEWQRYKFGRDSRIVQVLETDGSFEKELFALDESRVLDVRKLPQGNLEIKTRSRVGSFYLGKFRLDIFPKISSLSLLKLLRYGFYLDKTAITSSSDLGQDSGLDELLRDQLSLHATMLIENGLRRNYQSRYQDLVSPRGRIMFSELAKRGGITGPSLPCTWHPRLFDTPINRVLKGGLIFAARGTHSLKLRNSLQRLAADMEMKGVKNQLISLAAIETVRKNMTRLEAMYLPSISILELLLQGAGSPYTDHLGETTVRGFHFEMSYLYQRIIGRLISENLPEEYSVTAESRLTDVFISDRKYTDPVQMVPRPDFVIRRGGKVVHVLDTKYVDLDNSSPGRDILYQMSLYALTRSFGQEKRADVLYPSTGQEEAWTIRIQEVTSGKGIGKIGIRPVNLNRLVQIIDNRDKYGLRRLVNEIIQAT